MEFIKKIKQSLFKNDREEDLSSYIKANNMEKQNYFLMDNGFTSLHHNIKALQKTKGDANQALLLLQEKEKQFKSRMGESQIKKEIKAQSKVEGNMLKAQAKMDKYMTKSQAIDNLIAQQGLQEQMSIMMSQGYDNKVKLFKILRKFQGNVENSLLYIRKKSDYNPDKFKLPEGIKNQQNSFISQNSSNKNPYQSQQSSQVHQQIDQINQQNRRQQQQNKDYQSQLAQQQQQLRQQLFQQQQSAQQQLLQNVNQQKQQFQQQLFKEQQSLQQKQQQLFQNNVQQKQPFQEGQLFKEKPQLFQNINQQAQQYCVQDGFSSQKDEWLGEQQKLLKQFEQDKQQQQLFQQRQVQQSNQDSSSSQQINQQNSIQEKPGKSLMKGSDADEDMLKHIDADAYAQMIASKESEAQKEQEESKQNENIQSNFSENDVEQFIEKNRFLIQNGFSKAKVNMNALLLCKGDEKKALTFLVQKQLQKANLKASQNKQADNPIQNSNSSSNSDE